MDPGQGLIEKYPIELVTTFEVEVPEKFSIEKFLASNGHIHEDITDDRFGLQNDLSGAIIFYIFKIVGSVNVTLFLDEVLREGYLLVGFKGLMAGEKYLLKGLVFSPDRPIAPDDWLKRSQNVLEMPFYNSTEFTHYGWFRWRDRDFYLGSYVLLGKVSDV